MQRKKIQFYAGLLAALLVFAVFVIYNVRKTRKTPISNIKETRLNAPSADSTDGEIYTHADQLFSFRYSHGFQVSSYQDISPAAGETIVVERGEQESFQISIAPFDEEGLLTKERIMLDLPDIPISEENSDIIVDGVRAFGFSSEDEVVGKTYEIWAVHGGYLYQISAPLSFKKTLMNILSTWEFLR